MENSFKVFSSAMLLCVSFITHAFEYHGIKSGMSRKEVDSITLCTKKMTCSKLNGKKLLDFFGKVENIPPDLWAINFSYTSDNKLWRIQLDFLERDGPAGVAQSRILRELYPDAELEKSTSLEPYEMKKWIHAKLIDRELYTKDIEKIYSESKLKY